MSERSEREDIGTVRWYGISWGAPVCEIRTHVPTPVGQECLGCGATITELGQGVGIPFFGDGSYGFYGLDCWLHNVGVRVVQEVAAEHGYEQMTEEQHDAAHRHLHERLRQAVH